MERVNCDHITAMSGFVRGLRRVPIARRLALRQGATMVSLRCATLEDGAAVARIYAPIVRDTFISFEEEPPLPAEMSARIKATSLTHPWLVAELDGGVVAYAYASPHRSRPAYRWSCDVSVYVDEDARRMGAARGLYDRLFETLKDLGYANAFAGIALPNASSVGFHERMGFEPIGVYPRVGFKRGSWRDVGWWSRPIQDLGERPAAPRPYNAGLSA